MAVFARGLSWLLRALIASRACQIQKHTSRQQFRISTTTRVQTQRWSPVAHGREWWAAAHARYELISSDAVVEELEAGTSDRVPLRLALLRDLRVLKISSEVLTTVQVYLRHKLMPANPGGDALHLALASHFECDFIVTWNCKHLANTNKFAHIRKINTMLGLSVPEIVTPEELLRRNR